MAFNHDFYFTEFDAMSAQLDLMIGSPDELNLAVGPVSSKVSGPVHLAAWIRVEGIGKESSFGQCRLSPITAGDSGTGDVQLSGNTTGHGLAVETENVHAGVPNGPAYEDGILAALDAVSRGPDGCFRRAIQIPQLPAAR
jgi:hypothetical protein